MGNIPTDRLAPHRILLISQDLPGFVALHASTWARQVLFLEFTDHGNAIKGKDALLGQSMVIDNGIIIQMAHALPPVTDLSKQQHQHFGHLWHILTQQQGQLNNVALIVPELLHRLASVEQQLNIVAAHLDLLVSLSTSVHLNGPSAPDNVQAFTEEGFLIPEDGDSDAPMNDQAIVSTDYEAPEATSIGSDAQMNAQTIATTDYEEHEDPSNELHSPLVEAAGLSDIQLPADYEATEAISIGSDAQMNAQAIATTDDEEHEDPSNELHIPLVEAAGLSAIQLPEYHEFYPESELHHDAPSHVSDGNHLPPIDDQDSLLPMDLSGVLTSLAQAGLQPF